MRALASLSAALLLVVTGATIAEPQQPAAAAADPRSQIVARVPGTRIEDLRATPVPGIYELAHGADVVYVSADGRFAFSGDLIDLTSKNNLTEAHRRDARAKLIAAIPESDMLVFGPRDAKYTVTVFTDVDCAYCRQLHSQIAQYNQLGIRVRYLFFPRSGPNTQSWFKAEEVWCSADRKAALTKAKLGGSLDAKACPDNPVARHYALAQGFGIQGTPAIVLASGELIGGYLPPQDLARQLGQATR